MGHSHSSDEQTDCKYLNVVYLYSLLQTCEEKVKTQKDQQKYNELLNSTIKYTNFRKGKNNQLYITNYYNCSKLRINQCIFLLKTNKLPLHAEVIIHFSSWNTLCSLYGGIRYCKQCNEIFCDCLLEYEINQTPQRNNCF